MLIDLDKHKDELFNPLIYKLQKAKKRYVISYGGAGSSKSYSQTQHEIIKCLQSKEKILVIRKVNSTLKDSVISLFKTILNDWGLIGIYSENKTDQTISFINGSQILFKGLDDPEKIKSIAGITRVWVEEATELSQSDFQQLNLRLRGRNDLQITLTFNPIDEEHWIKSFFFDNPATSEKTDIIKTTYLDNKFIDDTYKEVLESYKEIDKNYYKIYALGEFGGITEGRIFNVWHKVDKFPEIPFWYGLDFGFSNDPTAIVKTGTAIGRIYAEEICYQTGMTNQEIASLLFSNGYNNEVVFCDSAEPKSIEELIRCGINAYPANKGQGSIMAGIDKLRASKVVICGYSPNLERENKYYQWKELPPTRQTANKRFENTPKDWMNHCFIGSTNISTINGLKRIDEIKCGDFVLTSNGYRNVLKTFDNGTKQVYSYLLQFDTFSLSLSCTENHNVKTNDGWKRIKDLEQGNVIFLHKSLITKSSINIPEKTTTQREGRNYIEKFGSSIMAIFQKGFTSIISTKMLRIIQSKISRSLMGVNTYHITPRNFIWKILNLQGLILKLASTNVGHGTDQRKALSGTLNTAKNHIEIENIERSYARSAETNIEQSTPENPNTAIITARLERLEKGEGWEEKVYDLMIDDTHEYFANGVLVHNCIDSLRYAHSWDNFNRGTESAFINASDL